MKLSIVSTSLAVSLASAQGSLDTWAPGGETDLRGPCPMMNTLANHGFLPHDGTNITLENAVHALTTALNFNESVAIIMWQHAVIANPEPNATFFTLGQLNVHNVLEHDASISRSDAALGNNHVFNQTIFDTTTAFWTGDTLTATMLANGKMSRQLASKAFNPEYSFTSTNEAFSLGEMSAPILIFGDIAAGTVRKDLVISFFENEKLPTELGWVKQANAISLEQVGATSALIAGAASLQTNANSTTSTAARRRDLHAGFYFNA